MTLRPVNIGTGSKFFIETDVTDSGAGHLAWSRTYNSLILRSSGPVMSVNWTHTYSRWVQLQTLSGVTKAYLFRPDGSLRTATLANSAITNGRQTWAVDATEAERLVRLFDVNNNPTGWLLYEPMQQSVETYDPNGVLLSIAFADGVTQTITYSDGTSGANGGVILNASWAPTFSPLPAGLPIRITDSFGRTLSLGYDLASRVVQVTDPNGQPIRYTYNSNSNLATVTYPDGKQRQYVYNESANTNGANLPNAITGLLDENGNRLATVTYATNGQAINSRWWSDSAQTQAFDGSAFTFNTGNTTTITDALGSQRTTSFTTINGRLLPTSQSQPAGSGCGASSASTTYDANANITSRVDFNGNKTCYAYDTSRNLETARVEGLTSGTACPGNLASYTPAANTPQRLIQTQWHPDWRIKTRAAEPNKITTSVYNGQPDPTNGNTILSCAPSTALVDGKPIAVLCKRVEQATADSSGANGFSATASGSPRVSTFTYNATGQVLTATGPRGQLASSDPNYAAAITTFAYYASNDTTHTPPWYRAGDLQTITDAAGHVTQFTKYDGAGRPLTILDANNQTTTLVYNARGWLTSRTAAGETTGFGFDGAGNLTQLTLVDGSTLAFVYDNAHRLTSVTDNLANKIVYTLDAMGNRTAEQTQDPSGALKQSLSRAVDALNRVQQQIDAPNTATASTWQFQYDASNNPTQTTDPRGQSSNQQFDALNRVVVQLQPAPLTNGTRPQASIAYNGNDAVTQITDPRSLATSYTVDGLGNLAAESSPDRGPTNRSFDVAGNLISSTDARGKTTTYRYDALNRLTQASYATGTATVFAYDQGTNGIGHLTSVTDESGSTSFTFNAQGRIITKTTTFGTGSGAKTRTTSYVYGTSGSSNGHVVAIVYPSANQINLSYDSAGRVNALTLNPTASNGVGTDLTTTIPLLANITYQPFGPVNGWTWGAAGSGHTVTKTFDLNGRMTSYPLGDSSQSGLVRTLSYDAANRITAYTHVDGAGQPQTAYDQSFSYDNLNRLTSFTAGATSGAYTFDLSGNRSSHTINGTIYSDSIASTSNRLTSTSGPAPAETNTFDAAGNITGNGTWTATISDRGKMASFTLAGNTFNYLYNGLEQRASKSGPSALLFSGKAYYVYDESGHLTGEYDGNLKVIEETVYLGDTPVIVIVQKTDSNTGIVTTTASNIYADHLNAPQVITRASDHKMRWRWMPDPFGTVAPNENPMGLGSYVNNPRGWGLFYDKESGLFYNGYRYLIPGDDRYASFDPLGLAGGSWSPYAHDNGDPLTNVDPLGLAVLLCSRPADIAGGLVDHYWVKTDTMSAGLGGNPNIRPGDAYEAPYITETYTIDHSKDKPTSCEPMNNVDEQCVNKILLEDLGRPQGRFGPTSNCQSYAYSVVNRCRTGPQLPPKKR